MGVLDSRLAGILLGIPDDQLVDDVDRPAHLVSDRKNEGLRKLELIKAAIACGATVVIVNAPASDRACVTGMSPASVNASASAEIAAVKKHRSTWVV